jgi:hypothetical protein
VIRSPVRSSPVIRSPVRRSPPSGHRRSPLALARRRSAGAQCPVPSRQSPRVRLATSPACVRGCWERYELAHLSFHGLGQLGLIKKLLGQNVLVCLGIQGHTPGAAHGWIQVRHHFISTRSLGTAKRIHTRFLCIRTLCYMW